MDVLDRSYAKSILILLLDHNGNAKKSDFSDIATSWKTLSDVISGLQQEGYLTISEQIRGRKTYEIKITDKGRQVAKKLKEAEEVADSPADQEADAIIHFDGEDINVKLTPEQEENTKYLKFLFHSNVLDNHISVEEAVPGKPTRNFNIYVKRNGNGIFRLWCELDESYTCWHVSKAWGYPQVQKMMTQYKGRVKICPVCGYENPENAKYCMECGAKLE